MEDAGSGTRSRTWVNWIILPLVAVGALAVAAYVSLPFAAAKLVDRIYKNVSLPLDQEMPSTITQFRPSLSTVSILGGMGEGLNCSIPGYAEFIFDRRSKFASKIPLSQRFRQACVFHDMCYRHGLATYGFSQNDCDNLLQEQALRICANVSATRRLGECQLDAKLVAAGVKVFGSTHFQNWQTSTYFEFDPMPLDAPRFFVGRSIPHPFKMHFPEKLRDEPDELLLSMEILRSGVRSTCLNCPSRNIEAAEYDSAGLTRTENREFNEQLNIWMPPSRFWGAPTLIELEPGKPALAWLTRQSLTSSETCVVLLEAAKVFGGTPPRQAGCRTSLNPQLSLLQTDILSTAPHLHFVPSSDAAAQRMAVAAGITTQRSGKLDVCLSVDIRKKRTTKEELEVQRKNPRACHELRDSKGGALEDDARWAAFQNFRIARGNGNLLLVRGMGTEGEDTNDHVTALQFQVTPQHLPGMPAAVITMTDTRFKLDDRYDPLLPLSHDAADTRLVSMIAKGESLTWHEIDIGENNAKAKEVVFRAKGTNVELHKSWMLRPVLVQEHRKPDGKRETQLVFSRSTVPRNEEKAIEASADARNAARRDQPDQAQGDKLTLEIAVFERPTEKALPEWFELKHALTCRIDYTISAPDPSRIERCRRSSAVAGSGRATPATMLGSAQLLTGRFAKPGQNVAALVDYCIPEFPVLVDLEAPAKCVLEASCQTPLSHAGRLVRKHTCRMIDESAHLGKALAPQ